ncbi:MAG: GAF domain-containing protein [Deltaproteobacteria bacterium]|nr:GAF domain-containing protein [Deltaproteobacteria bacterium]
MKEEISVLILEDNPEDFFLLKKVLDSSEEMNINIIHADGLRSAFEKTDKNSIDVAILDLCLPDSYGLDTFSAFNEKHPLIPAIIMTGIEDIEMALSAVKEGAQDYICKEDSSATDIFRTIRYTIERHRLITKLRKTQVDLQRSLAETESRVNETEGFLKGARAVLEQTDFQTTARKVFDICSELIGSTSGYVALLTEDGAENEVLFLEAGGRPCTVDPELPMPIRGLRETAYRTNKAVYDNDFMNSPWLEYMPKGHVRLKNVLFSPLVLNGKTVGIMGLANKTENFTENDARIATGFGELAAIALQNSRNLDERDQAETQNQALIEALRETLANVKQLSGLLPICCNCKKIRDDKGYWNEIEKYIHDHSEVQFSHGICRECAEKLYPDMNLYDD